MVRNYFKIAIRNLFRNKVYSLINIIGLSVGIAGCLLVANVVLDDISYDKDWKNGDNIYRIITTDNDTHQSIPVALSGLAPSLQKNFPEVKNYCRLSIGEKYFNIQNQNKVSINCINTEPSFLNLFDFSFLQNSALTGKNGYSSVIITKKIADKYFPNENPIGKTIQSILTTGSIDSTQYIVTGIVKGIPYNSHLRADAIVLKSFNADKNVLSEYGVGMMYASYLLLQPGTDTKKLSTIVNKWYKGVVDSNAYQSSSFQPLKNIYLHSDFAKGYQPVIGSVRNVYIFSGIAIVLLLIACFNFINLTTARALKRIAETSVRKVLGANRYQLVAQFLFESLIFFIASFIIALIFYQLFIKPVEIYLGHNLTVSLIQNIQLLSIAFIVLLLVCLFTGIYPALVFAKTKTANALKGNLTTAPNSSNWLRKSLVVLQFSISIIILIATIVVKQQLFFLNHTDVGYDKNNLLQINYTYWGDNRDAFKQAIKNLSGVENASIARWSPGSGGGSMSMKVDNPNNKNEKINVWFINGDIDFVPTLKLHLQQGRLLSDEYAADVLSPQDFLKKNGSDKLADAQAHQSELLSAYAAKKIYPKGFNQATEKIPGMPVGIVSDFHNESLKTVMQPCVITGDNDIKYGSMLIRVKHGAEAQVIHSLNKLWSTYYPLQTLDYEWVSDALTNQYKAEQKTQQLFFFFSCLTVFLACLGLFGLVIFTTEVRTKEIGIRKVLGASTAIITKLISKDFLQPVIIAIFIGSPVAYLLMNKWLQDYAYRINVSWRIIAAAGLICVLIAFVTVSFQAIKAAMVNPIKSLRTE